MASCAQEVSYGACDALRIIPVLGLWRANEIDD
jgi:hypothetical protein